MKIEIVLLFSFVAFVSFLHMRSEKQSKHTQTGRQTGRQTHRQTDTETDRQTNTSIDRSELQEVSA